MNFTITLTPDNALTIYLPGAGRVEVEVRPHLPPMVRIYRHGRPTMETDLPVVDQAAALAAAREFKERRPAGSRSDKPERSKR